jgi:hypothetical protein
MLDLARLLGSKRMIPHRMVIGSGGAKIKGKMNPCDEWAR